MNRSPEHDWIRHRRDDRLVLVLRFLIPAAGVGALSVSPAFLLRPVPMVGLTNFGLLCGLCTTYGVTWWLAANGRFDHARTLLFASWLAYLGLQLGMFPGPEIDAVAQTLTMTVGTAFAATLIAGIMALEDGSRAVRWIVGALMVYGASGVWIGLRHFGSFPAFQIWMTLVTFGVVLLACAGAFVHAFSTDFHAALARAEQASRAKSRFLANMSHELRTPLNGILGYTELLREEVSDPQLGADLQRIWVAATHLHGVIGDVLDLSKIEADKLELTFSRPRLGALVEEVVSTAQPMAARNGNSLEVRLNDLPDDVWTDEGRLRQVLLNLLSNACKFTEGGWVRLTVEGRDGGVSFEVADSGIGIPASEVERVFLPFEQVDGSTTRRYGGTGLGLAISRHLVHLLGGELALASAPGEGAAFSFHLPRG